MGWLTVYCLSGGAGVALGLLAHYQGWHGGLF